MAESIHERRRFVVDAWLENDVLWRRHRESGQETGAVGHADRPGRNDVRGWRAWRRGIGGWRHVQNGLAQARRRAADGRVQGGVDRVIAPNQTADRPDELPAGVVPPRVAEVPAHIAPSEAIRGRPEKRPRSEERRVGKEGGPGSTSG